MSMRGLASLPPVSMPFTAASATVLSTVLAASWTFSAMVLRTMGEVLKRRAWRAKAVRIIDMVIVFLVVALIGDGVAVDGLMGIGVDCRRCTVLQEVFLG